MVLNDTDDIQFSNDYYICIIIYFAYIIQLEFINRSPVHNRRWHSKKKKIVRVTFIPVKKIFILLNGDEIYMNTENLYTKIFSNIKGQM